MADVAVRVFPLAASAISEPVARAYAEQIVWPEMRHAVASLGRQAGMTDADVAGAEVLLDPTN